MQEDKTPKTNTALDYVYAAPAILLALSFLCGIIPSLICMLSKVLFAYISVIIFFVSIVFHLYILAQWRKYWDYAPLAYGIIQPTLHLAAMAFSMTVSAASLCNISTHKSNFNSVEQLFPVNSAQFFINYNSSIVENEKRNREKTNPNKH